MDRQLSLRATYGLLQDSLDCPVSLHLLWSSTLTNVMENPLRDDLH